MVENQLRARGIWDERVLAAMAEVPREAFVPRRSRHRAYADSALPIGGEQTISQPWIVAAICQELALTGAERVLEVGTGSGYSAAVLALLARRGDQRRARPRALALGPPGAGRPRRRQRPPRGRRRQPRRPRAGAVRGDRRPRRRPGPPPALVEQLRDGGRLVVPVVEEDGEEMLVAFHRHGERLTRADVAPCRFVPLIGEGGFRRGPERP